MAMATSRSSMGIGMLLEAEQRASEKIADARKRRTRLLKQAKEAAQIEIESFKRKLEEQYQVDLRKVMGVRSELAKRIDIDTDKTIAELDRQADEAMGDASSALMEVVCDVQPKLHINYGL